MPQYESQFEENLYQLRREKLAQIVALGQQAYPNSFAFTHTIPELLPLGLNKDAEALEAEHLTASVAGRIVAIRLQGKAGFATLQQGGARLQIYVRKDDVGEPAFDLYKLLDLGDHIGVSGHLMRTRTGELTLKAGALSPERPALTFLTKAMLPLPDKFNGLGDIELRYRRRYLDLFTDTGETPEPATEEAATPSEVVILSEAKDLLSSVAPHTPVQTRPPSREVFVKRAAILRSIRNFFDTRGYLEVETPMLHTIAGGAAARTFNTHHNAEDLELNLRIAPELFLKRLVVGGLDRVYEINRNFRNEGIDRTHNPEFTMLEFYQAYANYHDLMDLTEELIQFVATEVNGTTITHFNGVEIDLSKWTKLSMREAIIKFWPSEATPPAIEDFADRDALSSQFRAASVSMASARAAKGDAGDAIWIDDAVPSTQESRLRRRKAEIEVYFEGLAFALAERKDTIETGNIIAQAFEALAEEHLIQPTIIYDFPLSVSPLSKVKPDEPDWVERFEFYIGGFEVGNAFSELNDPDDQHARFAAQVADKDPESMAAIDEDYVRALGYGLPPTAGEGIGIDRLTMVLTGSRTIRDVILFPLMRPIKPTAVEDDHSESPE